MLRTIIPSERRKEDLIYAEIWRIVVRGHNLGFPVIRAMSSLVLTSPSGCCIRYVYFTTDGACGRLCLRVSIHNKDLVKKKKKKKKKSLQTGGIMICNQLNSFYDLFCDFTFSSRNVSVRGLKEATIFRDWMLALLVVGLVSQDYQKKKPSK